jgi:hypothetical protein
MRGRLVLLMMVAITPLVALACSHELAIDDWVVRADQVCERAQASSDANPAPQSPLPGDRLRLTAQRSRDELDELRKLDDPSTRKSSVAEYLLTLEHRSDELVNYADALDKAPAQGPLPDRSHLEDLTTQAYTQGVALGLEHCNGGIDFSVDTTTTTLVPSSESTTPVPTAIGGQPENEENTEDLPGTPE